MGDKAPQRQLRQQVRELERRLEDTREELAAVKDQQPTLPLGLDTQMGRRQAMLAAVLGGGAAAGGLTALSQPAQADAVAADVGTQADPWRTGFFAALNAGDGQQLTDWETGFNAHAATKSSAYTTSGEHFIDVDTSISGVTITLATADTVLGHYIVLRQNGANDVTIDTEGAETIDGSSSLTLQHDQAVVTLWSDGSNWFSDQFTDTVDARRIDVGTNRFVTDGDVFLVGPSAGPIDNSVGTAQTSWTTVNAARFITQWDEWLPASATSVVYTSFQTATSTGDVRVRNLTDGETIHSQNDISAGTSVTLGPTSYTPTTTGSAIDIATQVQTNDGGSATNLLQAVIQLGIKL